MSNTVNGNGNGNSHLPQPPISAPPKHKPPHVPAPPKHVPAPPPHVPAPPPHVPAPPPHVPAPPPHVPAPPPPPHVPPPPPPPHVPAPPPPHVPGKFCPSLPNTPHHINWTGGDGNQHNQQYGTDGPDVIQGTPRNDDQYGLRGNDILSGTSGDDRIRAGKGNDRVSGGDGNDSIHGDKGSDYIDGGAGADTALFPRALSDYRIERTPQGEILVIDKQTHETDRLVNIEYLRFGGGAIMETKYIPVTNTAHMPGGDPVGPSVVPNATVAPRGETVSDGNQRDINAAGRDSLRGPEGGNLRPQIDELREAVKEQEAEIDSLRRQVGEEGKIRAQMDKVREAIIKSGADLDSLRDQPDISAAQLASLRETVNVNEADLDLQRGRVDGGGLDDP